MRGETRAIAEMSKDDTALHTRLRHEILVRQAVEAVTSHALALVAARNRQQLCDTQHAIVKRSVETGDLRRVGKFRRQRFHERDFNGKMFRIEGADGSQVTEPRYPRVRAGGGAGFRGLRDDQQH